MATAQRSKQQQQRNQSQSTRRVLRIGVILGGKIVEEKLVRERIDITVGQSAKNTFSVPEDGLPRTWPLFTVHDDRYVMRFSDSMSGRLSEDDDVVTFDALKNHKAQRQGDGWVVPLSDGARGKIVVGEMTLLFQFVAEPPMQPRPHLPASVRGTFADRIDPNLAIILAVSILIHFSVALYAYQRDRVIKTRTTRIFNETFQQPKVVAPVDLKIEQPKVENKTAEKTEKKKPDKAKKSSGKKAAAKKGGSKKSATPGQRSAEERMRLEEETRRLVSVMTGDLGATGIGSDASGRDPRGDLDAAINEIAQGNARVEIGAGSGREVRGDGSSEIGTGQGPAVEGPGTTTTTTERRTREKVPKGRVKLGGGTSDDDTTLRPDAVMRKIKTAYMSGLKRCHKELLKRDPSAGGRVSLKFMVGPSGRITRVKASGFDGGVDKCIESRAKSWRFGVPKDEDGDPTDATFKISLVLQAD